LKLDKELDMSRENIKNNLQRGAVELLDFLGESNKPDSIINKFMKEMDESKNER
jgi:hypothetical protein